MDSSPSNPTGRLARGSSRRRDRLRDALARQGVSFPDRLGATLLAWPFGTEEEIARAAEVVGNDRASPPAARRAHRTTERRPSGRGRLRARGRRGVAVPSLRGVEGAARPRSAEARVRAARPRRAALAQGRRGVPRRPTSSTRPTASRPEPCPSGGRPPRASRSVVRCPSDRSGPPRRSKPFQASLRSTGASVATPCSKRRTASATCSDVSRRSPGSTPGRARSRPTRSGRSP